MGIKLRKGGDNSALHEILVAAMKSIQSFSREDWKMTMPFTTNAQKFGPIEISQDDNHFLVRIHPENRDRAKKIAGRQWDGARKVWVYPKDLPTYSALVEEFQKDANIFDIRRPKTKRPAEIKPPPEEADAEEFEEFRSVGDLGEDQGRISDQLELIRETLESINDLASNQNRSIEELRDQQTETAGILKRIESPEKDAIKTEKVEVLPELLNFDNPKEKLLFEKALIAVAYDASKKSESFHKWVELQSPIEKPVDFVTNTHEKLKQQLEKIVGEADMKVNFIDLVRQAKQDKLIYLEDDDPIKVFQILYALNDIRNRFAHARKFHRSERWARSILYLMNLALVWPKIMMEPEDGHE
ncbi:MAG: hypothetical protein KJ822_07125 [Proteobacteria bacterium]|nr:hypothetical protein [Pseudomonadota bacterium]MBU4355106.1 hypothetical protein [Pseudomonadota bacterium]